MFLKGSLCSKTHSHFRIRTKFVLYLYTLRNTERTKTLASYLTLVPFGNFSTGIFALNEVWRIALIKSVAFKSEF